MPINIISVQQIQDELKTITKPTPYEGMPYPLNGLEANAFEILLYQLFKKRIENKEFKGKIDRVDLMSGVGEKGRDCLLTYQGMNIGLVQCKKYDRNIGEDVLSKEIIKFALYYLINSELITNIYNFTYYIAVSTGFTNEAITLLTNFNKQIISKTHFRKWTENVINKHATLKHFKYASIEQQLKDVLQSIKIEKITPREHIELWLHQYTDVADLFFRVRKVTDNSKIEDAVQQMFEKIDAASLKNSITINTNGEIHVGGNTVNIFKFSEHKELKEKVNELEHQLKDKQIDSKELKEEIEYLTVNQTFPEIKLNAKREKLKKLIEDEIRVSSKLNEAIKALKDFEMQIVLLAEQLNKIDLQQADELFKEAYDYFIQGELKLARKMLDPVVIQLNEDKILEREKKLQEEFIEIEKAKKQIADNWLFSAQLIFIDKHNPNRYKEAVLAFEKSIKVHPNVANHLAFADFLQFHTQYIQAAQHYEAAFNHARNQEEEAIILNNWANLLAKTKKFNQAKAKLTTAINHFKILAQSDARFKLEVLKAYGNLGNVEKENNHFKEAADAYQLAISGFRELISRETSLIIPEFASTLGNLGTLFSQINRFDDSLKNLLEAISIYRELIDKNQFEYLPGLALALNNVGSVYGTLYEYENAEKSYEEALQIQQRLAEVNPDAFLPGLAMFLANRSNFYKEHKKHEDALQLAKEVLDIYYALSITNPEAFRPNLANAFKRLGVILYEMRIHSEALFFYQQALTIQKELVETNPDASLPDLASTFQTIGNLYTDSYQFDAAVKVYTEALSIYENLSKEYESIYAPYIAETYRNLSILYIEEQSLENALDASLKAITMYQKLTLINPKRYDDNLSSAYINLGGLYHRTGQPLKAVDLNKKSLDIHQKLAEENPEVFIPVVGKILSNIGGVYSDMSQFPEATKYFNEALDIRRALANNNSTFLPDLAKTLNNFALLHLKKEDYNASLKLYEEALQILKELMTIDAVELKILYCQVLVRKCDIYLLTDSSIQVRPLAEEAHNLLINYEGSVK